MLLLQEQRPAVNFVEDALQKSVATCGEPHVSEFLL